MADPLQLSFEIEHLDCSATSDVETFVSHVARGSVSIAAAGRQVRLSPCGVLRVSRSLLRICTFPVLYEIPAFESDDLPWDFRAHTENDDLIITISGQLDREMLVRCPAIQAMRIIGRFHREVLLAILERCPSIGEHLLLQIPDAFALSGMARTVRPGPSQASAQVPPFPPGAGWRIY
jgi:hypothetical protein